MIRRARVAAALAAVVALLTGCAIPTSGDVQTVAITPSEDGGPPVAVATGPQPGASVQEILLDFLRAGRSPVNNYEVAHQFLARGVEWDPTARTLIYSTLPQAVAVDDDTMTLTPTVIAEVDERGRYTARESTLQLQFEFVQEGGEWRIAAAPDGTLIPTRTFAGAFAPYPLYFFDPSFDFLVPDLRWFPITAGAPRRIVAELLAGPSEWLQPAVVSAFPAGLEAETVSQPPDVTVELGTPAATESTTSQRRMLEQLNASLVGTVSNVNSVTVTVAGIPLEPGSGAGAEVQLRVRSDPMGGFEGRIGELSSDGPLPLPEFGQRADGLGATAASLSRDRGTLALLTEGGVVALRAEGGDPVPIDTRPGLAAPTTDPHGWVWTVPVDAPRGLRASNGAGAEQPLPIDLDGTVVGVEVSRDGTRLLVAVVGPSAPRLLVFGIIRNADLAPTGLGAPLELELDDAPVDIAWVDGDTVATIERAAIGTTSVLLHDLGGPVTDLGPLTEAVQIVGGNGENGIRVLDVDGTVLRRGGVVDWVDTGLRASFLGTQQ